MENHENGSLTGVDYLVVADIILQVIPNNNISGWKPNQPNNFRIIQSQSVLGVLVILELVVSNSGGK